MPTHQLLAAIAALCIHAAQGSRGPAGPSPPLKQLYLHADDPAAPAFPPGRPFPPSRFWTAAPMTQDGAPVLGDRNRPTRSAADFVASGEAAMLAWAPPQGAHYVDPLTDTATLVRFLGGLPSTARFPPGADPASGDVVRRAANGSLVMQWDLVFERLDARVNNSIQPVVVLDNVPWAFAPDGTPEHAAKYGNNMGPTNVSEYEGFLRTLLRGIVSRYGSSLARTFWFRVGTEPDTQPGHWNDTNAKFVDMYVAVARVVREVVPGAWVGPGNFAADGPTRQSSWDAVVVPIVQSIVDAGAPIDFLAMSCYGRALMCHEPNTWRPSHPPGRVVDHTCEYTMEFVAECTERLGSLMRMLPEARRNVPLQTMEYGDQENALKIVDSQPGAWGGAWTLASSVQMALGGVQRVFHWGYGDRNFGNGATICPKPLSPCGLYGGNIWVAAAASHLFGGGNATVLLNSSVVGGGGSAGGETNDGVVAQGIGGWGPQGELRLLISLFSASKTMHGRTKVSVAFQQPSQWGPPGQVSPMRHRHMLLDNTTSVYDGIRREAAAAGTLVNPADPNVYALERMVTKAGQVSLKADAERWLTLQNHTFTPTPWAPCMPDDPWQLACGADGACNLTFTAAPPTVVALWFSAEQKRT